MKGWFKVAGVRPDGDRTLTEQMMGLDQALAECSGKTVLDLGAAEGLIGIEFAKRGATVLCVELLQSHIDVGRKVVAALIKSGDLPPHAVRFVCAHLDDFVKKERALPVLPKYDIVLTLGIIHKLHDPNIPMRFAAESAANLLCFRAPAHKEKDVRGDYLIKSKFTEARCNVPKTMRDLGFVDEGTINGVRGEAVQYWRRK